ncbi:MAG TPA: hypothetical protein VIE70_02885, partial [Dongiaceae bacterium]
MATKRRNLPRDPAKRRNPSPALRQGPAPRPAGAAVPLPSAGAVPRLADILHLGLLLGALALAYLLPFELLVLSYTVLG